MARLAVIPKRCVVCAGLAGVIGAGVGACAPPSSEHTGNGSNEAAPADTFSTSLHATRAGKAYFYDRNNSGLEYLTGVPISDLACRGCHGAILADGTGVDAAIYEPGCVDCHADPDHPTPDVPDEICLRCHSRQKSEQDLFTDVHRDMGFGCMRCHSADEMHGDGTTYDSMHESPAGAACENCHSPVPDHDAHTLHADAVDCSACHVQSVITCYNCHFDTQVAGGDERFVSPPLQGFKMLVQRDGKVSTATFQSLVYDGQSFYTIAPYYAHSIYKPDPSSVCDDCHASAALAEYRDTGRITVTAWDDSAGRLVGPSGVIPIPPDWRVTLQFGHLDYTGDPLSDTDPGLWEFLKADTDLNQMLFARPLTEEQMEALSR